MSPEVQASMRAVYQAQAECHERIRRARRRSRAVFILPLAFTFVLLLTARAPSADECRGLVNTRVTFEGAPGDTAGSVHSGRVYFHPQAPARDEPHFHILVPCERLRPVTR